MYLMDLVVNSTANFNSIPTIPTIVYNVPYDTKFWREKTLANLANYKWFAKIFFSKIFSFEWLCKKGMDSIVEVFSLKDYS